MLCYKSFCNQPIDSVTYLFYCKKDKRGLIIDPGTENHIELLEFLQTNDIKPEYIFLTHEHFDHILGVNTLREEYPNIKLCSSNLTSERLINPKKNLSIFYNQYNLIVQSSEIILKEGVFTFFNTPIMILETPGHTDSSLSFIINDYFISGDFITQNQRTITNLPTGSKKQYNESIIKCSRYLEHKLLLPGHGSPFNFQ